MLKFFTVFSFLLIIIYAFSAVYAAENEFVIEQVDGHKAIKDNGEVEKNEEKSLDSADNVAKSAGQLPNIAVREAERRKIIINQQNLQNNTEKVNEINKKDSYNADKLMREEKKYQKNIRKKKTKKRKEEIDK